jgi:hypothetical protein
MSLQESIPNPVNSESYQNGNHQFMYPKRVIHQPRLDRFTPPHVVPVSWIEGDIPHANPEVAQLKVNEDGLVIGGIEAAQQQAQRNRPESHAA